MARHVEEQLDEKRVVPVFWMASEDHDKDEIDHVSLYGETYRRDTQQQ